MSVGALASDHSPAATPPSARHDRSFSFFVKHDESLESVRAAELVPLERVPAMLPNRPDRSTVFRWAGRGCSGVKLKTVSVGRTRHTTERWLMQFFADVAAARDGGRAPVPVYVRTRTRTEGRFSDRTRTAEILRSHGLSETG